MARDAVGPDALLVVDAGGSDAYWQGDYKWALSTSHMLAGYGVAWFEKALPPDVTKVGGLRESRRIRWSAAEHGVRLIPHGWNTAVELAADIQLAAALPDTNLVEYRTGAPYIDELVTEPWRLDQDEMLAIPQTPGLGIELDPDAVKWYAMP